MKYWIVLAGLIAVVGWCGEPRKIVPMQSSPDQIYLHLRDRKTVLPASDCSPLDLSACNPQKGARPVTDISLRYIQLDADPELEAILLTQAPEEWTYMVFVFDKQRQWNLVGSFNCYRNCHVDRFVQVARLIDTSPVMLLIGRDQSGSAGYSMALEGFVLNGGKLYPSLQITELQAMVFPQPNRLEERLYEKGGRLIVESIRQDGKKGQQSRTCSVMRWDQRRLEFVEEAGNSGPCDLKAARKLPIHFLR